MILQLDLDRSSVYEYDQTISSITINGNSNVYVNNMTKGCNSFMSHNYQVIVYDIKAITHFACFIHLYRPCFDFFLLLSVPSDLISVLLAESLSVTISECQIKRAPSLLTV